MVTAQQEEKEIQDPKKGRIINRTAENKGKRETENKRKRESGRETENKGEREIQRERERQRTRERERRKRRRNLLPNEGMWMMVLLEVLMCFQLSAKYCRTEQNTPI